jgi:hypothetical protein
MVRRIIDALRRDFHGYAEIHQRRQLVDRPWREELLHFTPDGQVHGHLTPPDDRRRWSTTATGWCPQSPYRIGSVPTQNQKA